MSLSSSGFAVAPFVSGRWVLSMQGLTMPIMVDGRSTWINQAEFEMLCRLRASGGPGREDPGQSGDDRASQVLLRSLKEKGLYREARSVSIVVANGRKGTSSHKISLIIARVGRSSGELLPKSLCGGAGVTLVILALGLGGMLYLALTASWRNFLPPIESYIYIFIFPAAILWLFCVMALHESMHYAAYVRWIGDGCFYRTNRIGFLRLPSVVVPGVRASIRRLRPVLVFALGPATAVFMNGILAAVTTIVPGPVSSALWVCIMASWITMIADLIPVSNSDALRILESLTDTRGLPRLHALKMSARKDAQWKCLPKRIRASVQGYPFVMIVACTGVFALTGLMVF